MRATLYGGPRDISVGERLDPRIEEPTDAIVSVLMGCVCGSDMWKFRGQSPHAHRQAACIDSACLRLGRRASVVGW